MDKFYDMGNNEGQRPLKMNAEFTLCLLILSSNRYIATVAGVLHK